MAAQKNDSGHSDLIFNIHEIVQSIKQKFAYKCIKVMGTLKNDSIFRLVILA